MKNYLLINCLSLKHDNNNRQQCYDEKITTLHNLKKIMKKKRLKLPSNRVEKFLYVIRDF